MKKWIIALLLATVGTAYAVPLRVERRDMKLASQALLEQRSFSAPVLADVDRILDDQATSASATTSVTSFLAQPDVCRTLSITPGGTTADVAAGDVVVTGFNANGSSFTESFTFTANQTTIVNGSKAFCSVSSILFHQQDGASATFDVGVLDALGLHRCLDAAGHVFFTLFGGAQESTAPTITIDVDEVEKNTVDLDSALDGSTDVEVYFKQNFRCL